MRLLYLCIRKWTERGVRPERPFEYNLVTGYQFHLTGARLTVDVERRLPVDFFSVHRPMALASRVESVSAIIGENGSGKTSFAAVLTLLFKKKSSRVDYVCVFEDGDDVIAYAKLESKLEDAEAEKELREIGKRWIRADDDSAFPPDRERNENSRAYERPFDVSYYSPYLSTADLWDDERRDGYCDVSTGHYLQTRALDEKEDVDQEIPADVVAKLGLFSTRAMLEFAHCYVNAVTRKPDHAGPELPLPRYAKISVTSYELPRMIDDVPKDEKEREARQRRLENKQLLRAHAAVCSDYERDFLWRFVSELLLSHVRDLPYENVDYFDQDAELLIAVCTAVKEGAVRQSGVLEIPGEFAMTAHGLNYGAIKMVVEGLARHCYRTEGNDEPNDVHLMLDLVDKQDLDDAIDLAKWASRIRRKSPKKGPLSPLEVTLANMSSGEMAYWTLFSRLYESLPEMHKANRRMKCQPKNLLVVLDEAETTLHPEWQRCIVRNVIWFFETMTRGLSVHVVFASHSPIILSDIPMGNVVFLSKGEQEETWRRDLKNTFAANIFDLYRQPFSLVRGPIGELARCKVDAALQAAANCVKAKQPLDASAEEVLRLVGDPVLQAYLESLKKVGLLCYR